MVKLFRKIRRTYRRKLFLQRYNVGEFTYGVPHVFHWNEKATLSFGKFCSISSDVKIFLGGEHRTDWITTFPFSEFFEVAKNISGHPHTKGDVRIGSDVWIAHGATILSGVTISDGAVIGADAVVTGDVPPYAIVAGNPARLIKYRFEPAVIAQLLDIRWWDWPIEKIMDNVHFLLSPDMESFIKIHCYSRK